MEKEYNSFATIPNFISIQILCVDTIDSSPCIVVTTDNQRFLFDVGEGIQRLSIEHKIKLGKININMK